MLFSNYEGKQPKSVGDHKECRYLNLKLALILVFAMTAYRAGAHPRKANEASFSNANDSSFREPLSSNAVGGAALRVQVLLDRAAFSVGEIDGRIGADTSKALAAFRAAHNLSAADHVDETVWKALNGDDAPALVPYIVADSDVQGPFRPVPKGMEAASHLKHLGYVSPIEGLGERFHCNPALLIKLNPHVNFRKVGEQITVPNVRTPVQGTASKVVVSKTQSAVIVFDQSGKVLARYPCSTGSKHDPLPIGSWQVTGITRDPYFHYNPRLFWDARPGQSKATLAPGPNNPVGLVWIDISKEHYGIHGTPEPSRIGYSQSHGCIRLTNWDALELAGLVSKGTPVICVESQ